MVKRLFLALLALITAQAAMAANQKPPDVPTPVVQSATYQAGTTLNLLGTGTATSPSVPPYFTSGNMPADIPTPNRLNWTTIANGTGSYTSCSNPAVSCEAKFRSHLEDSHVLYDDPIRNYGEPGTSHCHDFFGNDETNAFSTYASLRNRSKAHSVGGRLNATAYWSPCMVLVNPFGDGKNYAARADVIGLYYKGDNSTAPWRVPLPPGLRYVGGTNMDDPQNTTRRREVIVANAQPGTAGRYSYRSDGFIGYACLADTNGDGTLETLTGAQTANGGVEQPYLNSTTGQNVSDPFLGNCKTHATSLAKAVILIQFEGPDCWDGKNPWVPGGYNNMRYTVGDTQLNAARIQFACPNGWYHIPALELKVQYTTSGWADYQRWRLSSDDAMQAKLNSLPTCTTDATGAYANAPCATRSGPLWNGTSFSVPNGASFHTDWMNGWDGLSLKQWEARCLGVQGLYNGDGDITSTAGTLIDSTPGTCAVGLIDPNGVSSRFMIQGAPPTPDTQGVHHNPIIDISNGNVPTTSPSTMFRIRTVAPSGMHDIHVH